MGKAYQVDLINEEDDVLRLLDLIQHSLQALLEFTPVLAARHQGAHVEGDDARVLEHNRHISLDDALRQALHNGGLSHACAVSRNLRQTFVKSTVLRQVGGMLHARGAQFWHKVSATVCKLT